MIKSLLLPALVLCVSLCSGCASIVSGQNQSLSVTTTREGADIQGAQCSLQNDKGSWYVTTPGSVTVHRSYKDLVVNCATDPSQPNTMQVKSTTKGMAFGNILVGGVIGVGVDVATGAAYDYPSTIAVALAPSKLARASAPIAVVAAAPPVPWVAGTRIVYLESDAISGAPQGEVVFIVNELSADRWVFNDGLIQCDADGKPQRGAMHGALIYGAGPREIARGGSWTGRFRTIGLDDAPVQITMLGKQTKVVSGRKFNAARLKVEGYATRSSVGGGGPNNGAGFEGEMLVDAESGLVLELSVTSRQGAYVVRRELVRVASN